MSKQTRFRIWLSNWYRLLETIVFNTTMEQEKLKIQRAFYDLIKELESLKDTNSAISDFKTSALEISVRLKDYLTSNASAFERMSNLYDSYLRNSENHIKTIQQTSEEMLSARKELTAKFLLLESTNIAIKEHEEAETIRNENIVRNLKETKQGLQENIQSVKEISQRVSQIEQAEASRNKEVIRNLIETNQGLQINGQSLIEISQRLSKIEQSESIRNEETNRNLNETKQGLQETRNELKETSQRVSNVTENIKSLKDNFENSERNLKEMEEYISERLLSIGVDIRNQRIWINGLGVLNLILAIIIIAILCR